MKWFRLNVDAMRHPKVAKLSHFDFRIWVELLSLAATKEGVIPCLDDVVSTLRRRRVDVESAMSRLSFAGLLDVNEGGWSPHNWEKYQMKTDSSTERVRRWRGSRNAFRNVSVTEHDTKRYETIDKRTTPNGVVRKNTGTRLTKDWRPIDPEKLIEWASRQTPSLDRSDLARELEAFRDYWTGEAKREASKLDWDAAFRTWLRRAKPKRNNGTFDARSRRQREILDYCEQLERDNGSEQQGESDNGLHRPDDASGVPPNGRLRLIAGGGTGEL